MRRGTPPFHRLSVLLVALTLALAGALAWQAVRAAASHQEAVETALEHHARTVAWRIAREARGWVGYGMNNAADALQRDVDQRASFPGPEALRRLLAQKYCDCMSAAFASTFVRVVADRDPALDVTGEPLSERARDDLRDRMLAMVADTTPLGAARRWIILPPGTPRLNRGTDVALLWRVEGKRAQRAIYGMIVERAQIERPLIGALESAQLFPPTIVAADTAATLVRVEVAGPNGAPLFASGPETHRFRGTDTLGAEYGSMIALAAINPEAAQVFVAGGMPESRVPMILALLALALMMGAAAALLLRREQRLAQLRDDFVSGVSHELRTPLTHIRALSELLEADGFRSSAERSRAIGIIHRESLRLTNLVDNVLAFTRLRRTRELPLPHEAAIPLVHVLDDLAESVGPLLEAGGSRLEVVVEEPVEVVGDRESVHRILRNLIDNAVKYGPASQRVRVTLARSAHCARITVDDQGPGIPESERARIWQPYYRLDRDRNAPAGGSGLGLSVVAELVRQLRGHAAVGDAPGGGARFTIDLPAAP